MSEVVVFVTVRDIEEGKTLARLLVEKRLAACANIIPHVYSIFEWEGKVSEEAEGLMVIKTTLRTFKELETEIKAHHSYSVPEIIALPIVEGSTEYLSWLKEKTKSF